MGEMAQALRMLGGGLPPNCVIQYPSGRWGFVGSVDSRLAYVLDGLTDEYIAEQLYRRKFGGAFCKLPRRAFDTREAAIAFAESLGLVVTLTKGEE